VSEYQKILKRTSDIVFSIIGLILSGWLILICLLIAKRDTGLSGIYRQVRIGKNARPFKMMKLRSMKEVEGVNTTITTASDMRITASGRIFRRWKLDELPQLVNVLNGDMSIIGPRPDVPGFADKLEGRNRIILSVRPGISGPASIYYKNEEVLLADQKQPEKYNREVIWPHKVAINVSYVENYSWLKDFYYMYKTVI